MNWKFLIGTAIISMGLFMYEVILSRLYSVLLSYHYAFMIGAIAILGMGIGNMIEYRLQSRRDSNSSVEEVLSKKAFQLGGAMVITFLLIYFLPYLSAPVYILINIIPYILAGELFAVLFTSYGEKSNVLYFADLVGSGTAAAGSIGLFYGIGFMPAVIITFALIFLGVGVWGVIAKRRDIYIASGLLGVVFVILSSLPGISSFIDKQFTGYMTSPNSSLERIRVQGASPEVMYTEWDGFARTDVIKIAENNAKRLVTINGGANAAMVQWDGNLEHTLGMEKEMDYIPYLLNPPEDVAIVGAGGGRDVLLALLSGAKNIDAIEINGSAVDVVKKMGDYNGKVYERPEVNVIVGDGRSTIAKSNKQYDVIFLSLVMTNTSESMGYAMAENYIYTEEAIRGYYEHLKPNGKLLFVAHSEKDMLKLGNTIYDVLRKKGIPTNQIGDQMVIGASVMNSSGHQMIHTPIVMVQNLPYSGKEIQTIEQFLKENSYSVLHLPTKYEDSYFEALAKGEVTLDTIIKESIENIAPATDDRPFFYNYEKNVPLVFLWILMIVALFVILFFVPSIVEKKVISNSIHFSLLGITFMIIENAMIQKMALLLEHPTIAFVVANGVLLIGAGVGSFFSHHSIWRTVRGGHLGALGAGISLGMTAVIFNVAMPYMITLEIVEKLIIAVILLSINGFFMGTIFPYSIMKLKEQDKGEIIPLAYGMNGVFSVVGSVLAMIISMQIGITAAILIGSALYMLIFIGMPYLVEAQ